MLQDIFTPVKAKGLDVAADDLENDDSRERQQRNHQRYDIVKKIGHSWTMNKVGAHYEILK